MRHLSLRKHAGSASVPCALHPQAPARRASVPWGAKPQSSPAAARAAALNPQAMPYVPPGKPALLLYVGVCVCVCGCPPACCLSLRLIVLKPSQAQLELNLIVTYTDLLHECHVKLVMIKLQGAAHQAFKMSWLMLKQHCISSRKWSRRSLGTNKVSRRRYRERKLNYRSNLCKA